MVLSFPDGLSTPHEMRPLQLRRFFTSFRMTQREMAIPGVAPENVGIGLA